MIGWRHVGLAVLFTLPWPGSGAEFQAEPLKSKLAERELSFAVTFDALHVNADFSKGNGNALTCPDVALGLRGEPGFDQRQAFCAEPGEELLYAVPGNLDPNGGTLSLWVKANDFEPGDARKKDNVGIFNIVLRKKGERLNNFAYFFGGKLYFTWQHFINEKPVGGLVVFQTDASRFKKGEYFQLLWSWDRDHYRFYINGEPAGEAPAPAALSAFSRDPGKGSYMGFNSEVWGCARTTILSIDDIKVFRSPLSPLMIKNRYSRLERAAKKAPLRQLDAVFSGVDRGPGKLPQLKVQLDGRCLEKPAANVDYEIRSDRGFAADGRVELKHGVAELLLDIPATAARYTLKLRAGAVTESITHEQPDLSFALLPPRADVIPEPWTELKLDDRRNVELWNRRYEFADGGPFPTRVTAGGEDLLATAPCLLADGRAISWQTGTTQRGVGWIEFTGTGRGEGFTLDYRTRVEFDGMIRSSFTVHGAPELSSLKLTWRLRDGFHDYLMTPALQANVKKEFRFGFPLNQVFQEPYMIWLASTRAGFMWMPESDANWVNADARGNLVASPADGSCEVRLISKKTRFPEAVTYVHFFAATPTRPAPAQVNAPSGVTNDYIYIQGWGERYAISGEIDPAHGELMLANHTGILREKTLVPYAMGYGLSGQNPTARLFQEAWDIPRMRTYHELALHPLYDEGIYRFDRAITTNACAQNSNFANYIIANQQKFLRHPLGNRLGMFYFDLANVNLCRNRRHGCGFTDRFGREVGTITVMGMRELFIRVLLNARSAGIPLMTHAQHCFTPIVNGIGDYWYPGEQFNPQLRRDKFAYTDRFSDAFWLTETNRDVLGCAVTFLPQLMGAGAINTPDATEAMMTQLLAFDIDSNITCSFQQVGQTVRSIFEHYGVYRPERVFHSFRTQNTVKSSDPRVRISFYHTPDASRLLVLTNPSPQAVTATVDITAVTPQATQVRDEYRNVSYPVQNGKFTITVPARNFALVGAPAKPWFPLTDDFTRPWEHFMNGVPSFGNWSRSKLPYHDRGNFRSAPVAMVVPPKFPLIHDASNMRNAPSVRDSYVRTLPVVTGKKYRAEIYGKTIGLPPQATVRFMLTPLTADFRACGDPEVAQLTHSDTPEWQKLTLEFRATSPRIRWVRCELASNGAENAAIYFDDFSLIEI